MKKPRPHCMTMKPICAMVEQASLCLMCTCSNLANWARMAVRPPITSKRVRESDSSSKGAKRVSKIPAPFTKPACIRAEAGVGAVMLESSQRWKGYMADCMTAAVMRQTAEKTIMPAGRRSREPKRSERVNACARKAGTAIPRPRKRAPAIK